MAQFSIKRMTLMKWHGYLSVFFLPALLLYICTGVLHMFDYDGESERTSIDISEESWPEKRDLAQLLVKKHIDKFPRHEIPGQYYNEPGYHEWWDLRHTIILKQSKNNDTPLIQLHMEIPDTFRRLLMVHRGYAGPYFKAFGISFGLYLLAIMITGIWLTVKTKPLFIGSIISALAGLTALALGFLIAL